MGRIVGWSESIEIRFASMLRRVNDWVSTNQRSLFRLLPVLIGLSSLVWLVPLTYFLFGTDSFHFVNPFDFNFNPLYQYSYLYSPTYPIPDSTPLFYLEGLLTILQGAGSPPWLTERIVIVSIAIIGAYGFFRLCGTWNVINDRPRYTGALRAALATTFYILNPLTLTVVWWHFGNYTIFYAFAPFLVSAFFSLTYRKTPNIPEICGTIALGIILAPGVSGAYAVDVALLALTFVIVQIVGVHLNKKDVIDRAIRVSLTLSIALALIGWIIIPFILTPNPGFESSNYVSPENLIQSFYNESQTTTLLNVLRLLGFSWIYQSPSAYPWTWYLPTLELAAFLIPGTFLIGVAVGGRDRGILPLAVIGIVAVFASVGNNPPAGAFNLALLRLHGPFLVLVNSYYILGLLFPLAISVGIFALLVRGGQDAVQTSNCEAIDDPSSVPKQSTSGDSTSPPVARVKRLKNRATISKVLTYCLVGALLVCSFPPSLLKTSTRPRAITSTLS